MDSKEKNANLIPNEDINVQIIENNLDKKYLVVSNSEYKVEGILVDSSQKSDVLEKIINNFINVEEQPSFCVPDSTLSLSNNHESVCGNLNTENNVYCKKCKSELNFKSKLLRKKSIKNESEVDKLLNHGFKKSSLEMKNEVGRKKTEISRKRKSNENEEAKTLDNSSDLHETIPIRKMQSRTLKTEANERIIQICSRKSKNILDSNLNQLTKEPVKKKGKLSNSKYISKLSLNALVKSPKLIDKPKLKEKRLNLKDKLAKSKIKPSKDIVKSLKIIDKSPKLQKKEPKVLVKLSKSGLKKKSNDNTGIVKPKRRKLKEQMTPQFVLPEISTINNSKVKDKSVKLSDVSIYDFVDEDYESEPIKSNCSRKQKISSRTVNIVKKAKNTLKKSKKDKLLKSNDAEEIRSNPDTISYEFRGVKYSLNDIVWAKIPGYPMWPAHIRSFEKDNSVTNNKTCQINWINWNQKSFLPLKTLFHFKDHFKTCYSSKRRSAKYRTAVELACKELSLDLNNLKMQCVRNKSLSSSEKNASESKRQKRTVIKKKKINLDDIFSGKPNLQNESTLTEESGAAAGSYSDEDTDEEEKARSALITAESLEYRKRISGFSSSSD